MATGGAAEMRKENLSPQASLTLLKEKMRTRRGRGSFGPGMAEPGGSRSPTPSAMLSSTLPEEGRPDRAPTLLKNSSLPADKERAHQSRPGGLPVPGAKHGAGKPPSVGGAAAAARGEGGGSPPTKPAVSQPPPPAPSAVAAAAVAAASASPPLKRPGGSGQQEVTGSAPPVSRNESGAHASTAGGKADAGKGAAGGGGGAGAGGGGVGSSGGGGAVAGGGAPPGALDALKKDRPARNSTRGPRPTAASLERAAEAAAPAAAAEGVGGAARPSGGARAARVSGGDGGGGGGGASSPPPADNPKVAPEDVPNSPVVTAPLAAAARGEGGGAGAGGAGAARRKLDRVTSMERAAAVGQAAHHRSSARGPRVERPVNRRLVESARKPGANPVPGGGSGRTGGGSGGPPLPRGPAAASSADRGGGADAAGGGGGAGGGGEEDKQPSRAWLQQKQVEVEFSLRHQLKGQEDVDWAQGSVAKLRTFMGELAQLARQCGVGVEEAYQELLSRTVDITDDFDSQHGFGDVPMHQAKVIDRSERLGNCSEAIDAALGARKADEMVRRVHMLRGLLRIKVEDANDLRTAGAALEDAHTFFGGLDMYAKSKVLTSYEGLVELRFDI